MSPLLEPVKILIAEDNAADVYLIREALKSAVLDFELFVVDDGEKAINFLSRADSDPTAPCPDLFLLDLNLPRKGGIEILQFMRSSRRCGHTPVVVLTSSDSPRDRSRVAQLGVKNYFRKPSDFDEFMKLGEVVSRVIAKAHPAS